MSTVRTAILKLAIIGVSGAAIGGGAVHVAEKASTSKPQYVKHAKPMPKREVKPLVRARKHETAVASAITCPSASDMEAAMAAGPEGAAKTGRTLMVPAYCFKIDQMAAIPLPPPAEPTFIPPGPVQQYTVMERDYYHGPAGGFYSVAGTNLIVVRNNTIVVNDGTTSVPGPPMLVLFGAAAAAIARRRKKVAAPA
ncbi:MAG: hypothetical protein RLY97_412 [Pseudomonadota bacterium]|jgi:uncharacterized protein (TIGR03382 family)